MASLALLAAVVFFGNLAYPFIEPDESRYAQIALEMVRSGDYVVPRLQGEPYLDKPPLLYWATAGSFQLFGVSELSARIPSALAATLTVLVTFLLGRRLLNDRAAYSGAILLFLCFGFVLSGRFVIMDGLLTLFTTTCLLAGFLALRGWHLRSGWWLVAAVACGLGMLTKGPIAPVLTIPPLLALQALSRYAARIHLRHWLTFVVVVAAITVPWFVAVGFAQPEFAGHFLWKHHVLRFVSAFNHRAPFWYYLPVLLIGMFPCSLLTAPIIAFLVGRTETLRKIRTEELGCLALAAVWIVGFFSVSSCKLPTYILPAVPLLCLVMGCMVSELLKGTSPLMALDRLAHQLPQYATTLAVLIGAMIAFTDLTLEPDRGAGKAINYCMLILAAAFLLHRLVHRRAWSNNTANWVVAAGACLLITVFAFQKFVPEFAGYRSIHANAARLQVNPVGKVLPVVYLDWQSDGYPFYLPYDHIEQFTEHDLQELTDYVRSQEEVVFVANPDGADMLREELGDDATFTRARGARGRLYVVTVTPRPTALFGSRRPERVQRGRMRR